MQASEGYFSQSQEEEFAQSEELCAKAPPPVFYNKPPGSDGRGGGNSCRGAGFKCEHARARTHSHLVVLGSSVFAYTHNHSFQGLGDTAMDLLGHLLNSPPLPTSQKSTSPAGMQTQYQKRRRASRAVISGAPALRLPLRRPPTCAGLWPDGPSRLHSQQLRLAPTPDSGPGRGLGRFPTHRARLLQLFSFF